MMTTLSIVIPVFNKWSFTKACLTDLNLLPSDHEIIIIDNASSDETNSEMTKLCDVLSNERSCCSIKYVQNSQNTFHSKACNQGYGMATGDIVLFLNNDIRVRANHAAWTKTLINACNFTKGIVGPTMGLLDNNLNFVKEANQRLIGNSYMGGWCVAARKDVWEQLKVGNTDQVWNEEFPMYFNDGDLSFRARLKNIPLTVIPLPDVVHFGKVSSSQVNVAKFYNEGRQVFIKKWHK